MYRKRLDYALNWQRYSNVLELGMSDQLQAHGQRHFLVRGQYPQAMRGPFLLRKIEGGVGVGHRLGDENFAAGG